MSGTCFGWKYRGTDRRIRLGDRVKISQKLAKENSVDCEATVVELQGFITVALSDGVRMDVDARQISLVRGMFDE